MPTLRRRNPDGNAGAGALRSSLANAALAVEDRVVWGAADLLRGIADAVKWPFQRIAWAVENFFVWPIQEETAVWSRATRAAVLAAIATLAGAAVVAGIVISSPSGEAGKVSTLPGPAAPAAVAGVARHTAPQVPTGPALHGSAPSFAPETGEGVPKSAESEVLRSESGGGAVAGTGAKEGSTAAGGAQANAPEVAGPAAIRVARRFADAFVLYEVGRATPAVKREIAATASPDLTKALLRRPPRLPSNVKVPKAKVLNIVVGPTHGSTYTLSASLLRVGVTSELRLDLKRVPGEEGGSNPGAGTGGASQKKQMVWQVTDVTG